MSEKQPFVGRRCLHNPDFGIADCPHYECTIHYAIWDAREARHRDWTMHNVKMVYLLLSCCVDCGQRDPRCLTFDHLPERGKKLFNISGPPSGATLADFTGEMTKCEIVCRNCHAMRESARSKTHYQRIGRHIHSKLRAYLKLIDAPPLGYGTLGWIS